MLREGFGHSAGGLVVTEVDLLALGVIVGPVVPGPHQGMLENGKLVGVVPHVVEELGEEALGNLRSAHPHGAGDGGAPLGAGETRNEVFTVVDRLRQPAELGAVAQVVRAHGEHDVDLRVLDPARLQQELHEGGSLLGGAPALLPETEEFLELVDHHEGVGSGLHLRLPDRLHQSERAAIEGGAHLVDDPGLVGIVEVGLHQGGGQVGEGIAAGSHHQHLPVRARARHGAPEELGQHSGADQGGFSAAGGTDHREEARLPQPLQQLPNVFLASEEEMLLVAPERPEAGEGIEERGHRV